ncbi:hypothetical protein RQP46_010224 [Phenoliferia psychrophenolica]
MTSHVETCTMLYKVLTDEEFKTLPLPPTLWRGTPFDLSTTPPIIHCAASIQVQATIDEVFADATSLWLLAIPKTPRFQAMLRFDGPGEGCAHLHLPASEPGIDVWSEVAVRRPITKGADGSWDIGELAW